GSPILLRAPLRCSEIGGPLPGSRKPSGRSMGRSASGGAEAAEGREAGARRASRAGLTWGRAMPEMLPSRDERRWLPTDLDLDRLKWTTLLYYLHETNPDNGLVRDKTDPAAPSSIAAVGLALANLPVVIERGVLFRPFAAKIARRRLRFLHDLPQGPEPDAAGYKGFFYHFLDIETGRRVWQCELST